MRRLLLTSACWLATVYGLEAQAFAPVPGVEFVGPYSSGSAWGDYDGDGDGDLFYTNWGTAVTTSTQDALYRSDGDGAFVNVAGDVGVDDNGNGSAAAWGDYDSDGDLDLFVARTFDGQNLLHRNDGGVFTEVGASSGLTGVVPKGWAMAAAWADFDNDGYPDITVGRFYQANEVHHNNGNGTFDRADDLGIGDRRDSSGLAWADFDNDGDLDLYVVNREQENALYRNEDVGAGGEFTDVGPTLGVANVEIGQKADWGDYDNDGDLDLLVANIGANALYRNDLDDGGGIAFVDVAAIADVRSTGANWISADAAWADVDGDGHLDLYLATGDDTSTPEFVPQWQSDVLLMSDGDGTFREATAQAGLSIRPNVHLSMAWGDIDDDGAPDLFTTDAWGGGNRMYRNDAADSLFLRVRVTGKGPAAGGVSLFGYGARVRLLDARTDSLVAFRQALPGRSVPLVHDDGGTPGPAAEVVFGVGVEDVAYRVRVSFPGNQQDIVEDNVRGGDVVLVREP